MANVNEHLRYEPDDPCPPLLSLGLALQGVVITLTNVVLFVTVTVRASEQGEGYLAWAVCAALLIGGVITALQAARMGRLGAGHLLMSGASPHFIAVSILAVAEGGPATMAGLIIAASLVQFAVAGWLPLLRRIITPVVSGVAVMLIAVTVMPIAAGRLGDVPHGTPAGAGPCVAAVTLAVAAMLAMRATGVWRFWAPIIGIASGCAAAAFFGLYDVQRVLAAPWVSLPDPSFWPGLDLRPGAAFWGLLPVFVIVSLVTAIEMSSDGVVIQQVSWVRPRATDFRLVQGGLNANGLGTLLSGLAGTLPTVAYSPSAVSLINLTGVAARRVGYAMGGVLLLLAFLPKPAAIVLAIPSPVMGAFLLMIMGLLFVEGIRTVVRDGLDFQKALVVAVSLSVGVGFNNQEVLTEWLGRTWGASFNNGMTVGILAAVLLTGFLELTSPRRQRLEVTLSNADLPRIDAFLQGIASRSGWNEAATQRLRAAGEETLSSLVAGGPGEDGAGQPRLIILARPGRTVELEFLAVFDDENLEDRLAYMGDQAEATDDRELSFRLLRHYASSVRHRKYHGLDVVTVQVEGSRQAFT